MDGSAHGAGIPLQVHFNYNKTQATMVCSWEVEVNTRPIEKAITDKPFYKGEKKTK